MTTLRRPFIPSGTACPEKPLRADARRNRERILRAARAVFAIQGHDAQMDDVAKRAKVGVGTVYRHFPTKESLFQAIVANRIEQLVEHARTLTAERDPGEALFAFLATLVAEGAADQGLVEALAGVGFDLADAAPDAEDRFMAALAGLLDRAQEAGAVRSDVDLRDLKTLLVGYQAMQRYNRDPAATRRLLAIVRDGLEPRPT
jgi:AcrR family transcriptional regulator